MKSMCMVVLVAAAAACGGAQQPATQTGGDKEPEKVDKETGTVSTMVSPEAYDAIKSYFKKKGYAVTQCQTNAIQNGKLDKKAQGRVTLEMVINAQGKPDGAHVAQTTLNNQEVEGCVVNMVNNWQVPAPGTSVNFSFSYDFHAE